MNWLEIITDRRPITAIFGNYEPSLDQVEIYEVKLQYGSPSRITYCINLNEFPKFPPKKWDGLGYNRVQIEMAFRGILNFKIGGGLAFSKVKINLEREASGDVAMWLSSGSSKHRVHSEFVSIVKITGYCSAE